MHARFYGGMLLVSDLLFHRLGELNVENVVVLSPQQKYFLQSKRGSHLVSL